MASRKLSLAHWFSLDTRNSLIGGPSHLFNILHSNNSSHQILRSTLGQDEPIAQYFFKNPTIVDTMTKKLPILEWKKGGRQADIFAQFGREGAGGAVSGTYE